MNEQELNQKFMAFEQQIKQLQEQMRAVEQAIFDMQIISTGLDDLKGQVGEEMLAPIGRGIFVKAKLLSETLTVDVGAGNFVSKSIDETKAIISDQSTKLKVTQADLSIELEKINKQITTTMQEHQTAQQ